MQFCCNRLYVDSTDFWARKSIDGAIFIPCRRNSVITLVRFCAGAPLSFFVFWYYGITRGELHRRCRLLQPKNLSFPGYCKACGSRHQVYLKAEWLKNNAIVTFLIFLKNKKIECIKFLVTREPFFYKNV